VLTNIASGDSEQTASVLCAVGDFGHVLQHGSVEAQEQVVWALANIAGDSPKLRDHVLQFNIVPAMLQLIMQHESRVTMLRNVTWALGNVCRGKPPPAFDKIGMVIPFLARLLSSTDSEVVGDALWAASYIADSGEDFINALLQQQVLPRVVEIVAAQAPETLHAALRILGNVCSGTADQTSAVLQSGALSHILPAMQHPKSQLRKEAVWLLSNITAGTHDQIQMVFDAGLMPHIMQLCEEGNWAVRKEALWAMSNAALGSPAQIVALAQAGAVKLLCEGLSMGEPDLMCALLDAIESVLQRGAQDAYESGGENRYCSLVEECGGLMKLEELQEDENCQVYNKAMRILTGYFEVENGDAGLMPAPAITPFFNFADLPEVVPM
jgi:hypothetical protein